MRRRPPALCVTVIAGALCATAAQAEMPYYDVTAHCQALARFGGAPSQLVLQGCYQQEQGAYDALKVQWEQLPAGMQQHCDGLARFAGPGSYLILQGCVTQEISAGRSNQDFQFRR